MLKNPIDDPSSTPLASYSLGNMTRVVGAFSGPQLQTLDIQNTYPASILETLPMLGNNNTASISSMAVSQDGGVYLLLEDDDGQIEHWTAQGKEGQSAFVENITTAV